MRAWAFWTCFWLFLDVVYGQLTTWDNQLFDFGWSPYDPTIVRCSTIQMGWTERQTSSPDSQPPYSIYVLRGGYLPIQIATVAGKNYNWTVELPTGGPYLLYMTDASGYTGGTSLIFNIQDATSGSCGTSTLTTTSLALTDDGNTAECSAITVTAQGTAPYTMQVMVAQRPPKTTTWTTSQMSYTMDIKPSEQFFVMVTDASGNVGLNGLHTVTNGDDSCYGVAPTITVGSAPTTLSYTPPSSSSSTRTTDSNTRGSQTATVLANTASQALTSVFTLANGSSTTLVLDPGESVSVPIVASTNNESKPQNLAVIVGSVVGAVAVIVIAVLIFFLMRSQKKQKKLVQQQQEAYEQRRQNAAPYQIGAAQVNPMMLTHSPNNPHSPGRDTAPLMNPTNSTYSSGAPTTPFVGTPGPGTPSINYFNMNPAAAPWANPEANIHPMTGPTFLRNSAHSPAPTVTTLAPMSEGLPPGAMPPVPIMASNSKSVNPVLMSTPMQPTKASYASSLPVSGEPSAPAPPPYTQRQ